MTVFRNINPEQTRKTMQANFTGKIDIYYQTSLENMFVKTDGSLAL